MQSRVRVISLCFMWSQMHGFSFTGRPEKQRLGGRYRRKKKQETRKRGREVGARQGYRARRVRSDYSICLIPTLQKVIPLPVITGATLCYTSSSRFLHLLIYSPPTSHRALEAVALFPANQSSITASKNSTRIDGTVRRDFCRSENSKPAVRYFRKTRERTEMSDACTIT